MLPVSPTDPWSWVRAIHILAIVVWIGGMFFAVSVLRPSIAALEPLQRIAVHNRVFRRFFLIVWHAMPIALITGFAMVLGLHGGFAGLPWNVEAMMVLGIVMAIVFVAVVFGPYRRFRAAVATARAGEAAERIRRLILLNILLGVITIVLAAI
jgi:uncharacterized membrane protein